MHSQETRSSSRIEPLRNATSGKAQRILYGGRWWLPPSPGRVESNESRVARGLS